GSAADADDIVQETFVRWLAQPTAELSPSWLTRVATNLGIDALRERRRRGYPGPWLPAPVADDLGGSIDLLPSDEIDPGTRYDLAESATLAFLIALEALGPRQRAVLLLRDVLGYSSSEAADALAT